MTAALSWVPEAPVFEPGGCSHTRAVPARYDHIDRRPNRSMAKAANRGIELRRKHGRGGTRKGRTMAGRISRRVLLSPALIRDMYAFFERFSGEASKQRGTEKWDTQSDKVSNLRIAWDLWGGDAGWAWSRRRRNQMEAADEEAKERAIIRLPWVQRSAYEQRTIEWRNWLESVQKPTERAMRRQWRRTEDGELAGLLPDQSKRYSRRVGAVLGESKSIRRAVSSEEMDAILMDDLEQSLLLAGFDADVVETGLQRAYARTARRFRLDIEWNPEVDPTDQIIGNMIQQVQQTTKDRVARIVRAGADQGISTQEIQAAILRDSLFGASRALRIARTETAKIVSEGTLQAYEDAADDDVQFRIEWISARDSDVRPTHEELDGQRVDVDEEFVIPSTGETAPGPGLFASASEVVNCFHPSTVVIDDPLAVVRSKYSGPMVEIQPTNGASLTVTPNHPVLTPRGFVAAKDLRKGDALLRYCGEVIGDTVAINEDHRNTSVHDLFVALLKSGAHRSVFLGAENLHGDAVSVDENVDIVLKDGVLLGDAVPKRTNGVSDGLLVLMHVRDSLRASQGALPLGGETVDLATSGFVSGGDLSADAVRPNCAKLNPLRTLGGASSAQFHTSVAQIARDTVATDSEFLAELVDRFAGNVQVDNVADVRQFDWRGHVYDLQTVSGLVVSNNIITSNCRCATQPVEIERPT